jgi:diguanylate cyclase (GGDEF)-like protein
MKLDRLHSFLSIVKEEFDAKVVSACIYYFFNDNWCELTSEKPCEGNIADILNLAKLQSVSHYTTNPPDVWFYFSDGEYVVRLTFLKAPRSEKRNKFRELLLKCEERASNAYRVTHNPLTQLLAKDAFREKLISAISDIEKREPQSEEAQDSSVARALCIMALDIDHFKQVNDTWGHLYGDQVLKTFGKRLEDCVEDIRNKKNIGNPEIYLGHPSGEEFLILIQANVLRDQFEDWANDFRKKIADDILPTDKEWKWLSKADSLANLKLPQLQDRTITASVGVVTYNNLLSSNQKADTAIDLLDRADTALYRAKAAGRNQVIFYDEILSSCGRVIEQDQSTRVVAIDIGSKVGVSEGQEFKVFSPTFSGKTKFLINDGRTKRTLGTYPRYQSARIIIFDAQPEISFAFVEEPEQNNSLPLIEAGSHLEAIPAGSIGHLLPSSSKYISSSSNKLDRSGISDLQEFVKASSKENNNIPFAIVVRFTRESEYLRKFGTAALNRALAHLYRLAQINFPAANYIEVLDRGSICIAGRKSAYKESIVSDFIHTITSELPELGVFAGVFSEEDVKTSEKGEHNQLDPANAVEFARFAAADSGRLADQRLRHFSYDVAAKVLQALRDSRSFQTAYADFGRLRSLGVESARLLNLGGLIAGSLNHKQEALEHHAAAIARDQETLIYKSNYGTCAYSLNEIDPALKILNTLQQSEIEQLQKVHPYGYVCYAGLLARAYLNHSIFFDKARFKEIASTALKTAGFEKSSQAEVIREALEKLSSEELAEVIRESLEKLSPEKLSSEELAQ